MPTDRCEPIRQQIRTLEGEIRELQEMLRRASPGLKPGLVALIRGLQQQLAAQKRALKMCEELLRIRGTPR
jgi:hypothetical protein